MGNSTKMLFWISTKLKKEGIHGTEIILMPLNSFACLDLLRFFT